MQRILLGQLGSNGDCLYATILARQIKADFPGCHLTWAISSLCRAVIENNPHIDAVWEVELRSWAEMTETWRRFEREAWAEVSRGRFDKAFLTQISPGNFARYDGTVRPSILRNYPRPVTVPIENIIRLSDSEHQRVHDWIVAKGLRAYDHTVIFECSSKSGQSFVTPALALEVADKVLQCNPNVCFVLSTHEDIQERRSIISGKALSMRETAALTHMASLFVGCGSGLTVVATSDAAKAGLPNIQILDASSSVYASFRHDFEYFGLQSGHFLESTSTDTGRLAAIIVSALDDGISRAKEKYDEKIPVTFDWYLNLVELMLIHPRQYLDAAESLMTTAARYSWNDKLLCFAEKRVLPSVVSDERLCFPRGKEILERFEAEIDTARRKLGRAGRMTMMQPITAPRPSWAALLRNAIVPRLRGRHPRLYAVLLRAKLILGRLWS